MFSLCRVSNFNEIFYSSQRHVDLFDLVSDLKKDAIKEEKSKEKDKDRAREKGKRVTKKGKERSKERENERRVKEKIVKMKDVEKEKGKEEEVFWSCIAQQLEATGFQTEHECNTMPSQ